MPFGEDAFTDTAGTALTSHTATSGGVWTLGINGLGAPVITDANRLRNDAAGYGALWLSDVPSSADYSVFCDVYVASVAGVSSGVVGRMFANGSVGYLAVYNVASAQWELYDLNGFGSLGTFSQTLTPGNTYRLELRMAGTSIKVYIDDVERIAHSGSEATVAAGAGVWVNGTATNSTGLHLDNFSAAYPVAGGDATGAMVQHLRNMGAY